MHDVIRKRTPEQVLEGVMRSSGNGSPIRNAVSAEARTALCAMEPDETAGEVAAVALDPIDVLDCRDRAGP